jgi:hypothetical protein
MVYNYLKLVPTKDYLKILGLQIRFNLMPGLWQIQIKRIKVNQRSRLRPDPLDHHYSGGPLFNPQVQILNLSNGWFVDRRKDKQMTDRLSEYSSNSSCQIYMRANCRKFC